MNRTNLAGTLAVLIGFAGAARAEIPHVATDIAPIYSLVAQVMDGVGTPDLIVRPGASPHGYALRPSEARALQRADLVVWMGPALTPWLVKPMGTVADAGQQIVLLDLSQTHLLPWREWDEESDHDADHEEGHEGHDDEHHGDEDNDADHADQGHDHDHAGGVDPHAWLDPENAKLWLTAIAQALAAKDPANADQYLTNAQAGVVALDKMQARITQQLRPYHDQPFVTFHDAFQYFEDRFDLHNVGVVSLSDAAAPSPADMARLQATIGAQGVSCAFSEPQFDPGLLIVAGENADVTISQLDPLGSRLEIGPMLYGDSLQAMADAISQCLGAE